VSSVWLNFLKGCECVNKILYRSNKEDMFCDSYKELSLDLDV
jgi:hypothetical protein